MLSELEALAVGKRRSLSLVGAAGVSFGFVGTLFLVKGVEGLFGLSLAQYGIVPRTVSGLAGIFFSPFLHADFRHLCANAVPVFVLLLLLLSNREYRPFLTLSLIWVASGLGTWLIGRYAVHIGASSLVFGIAAFLILAGFKLRSWRSAAVGVFVLLFYGGLFYGVLPSFGPVSWEGHLCGASAGGWIGLRGGRSSGQRKGWA